MQKSHPKMVDPRDIAGERRRRRMKCGFQEKWSLVSVAVCSLSAKPSSACMCAFVYMHGCVSMFECE